MTKDNQRENMRAELERAMKPVPPQNAKFKDLIIMTCKGKEVLS